MNSDKLTKTALFATSLLILIISAGIVFSLVKGSLPAFKDLWTEVHHFK